MIWKMSLRVRRLFSPDKFFSKQDRAARKKKMTTLVLLAPNPSSLQAAERVSEAFGRTVLDVDHLYGLSDARRLLGPEYSFCVTSEVALAATTGVAVVVGSNLLNACIEKRKKLLSFPLPSKLKKMLCSCAVDIVLILPQADRGDLPACVASSVRIVCHDDDMEVVSSLPKTMPTSAKTTLACNQVRVIYLDAANTARHETVFFDGDATFPVCTTTLPPLDPSGVDAILVKVTQTNGCALICLPRRVGVDGEDRNGQHITLNPGKTASGDARPAAKMRILAKNLEQRLSVCEFSDADRLDLSVCERSPIRVRPIAWAFEAFAVP